MTYESDRIGRVPTFIGSLLPFCLDSSAGLQSNSASLRTVLNKVRVQGPLVPLVL
jgi:hypothetical protein